jgi:hypothetical protein
MNTRDVRQDLVNLFLGISFAPHCLCLGSSPKTSSKLVRRRATPRQRGRHRSILTALIYFSYAR